MQTYFKVRKKTILYGLLFCIAFVAPSILLYQTRFDQTDFCQDYYSAVYALQGENIYQSVPCFLPGSSLQSDFFNPHPPFSIVPYLMLAIFAQPTASVVWGIIALMFYMFAFLVILKCMRIYSLKRLALCCLFGFLWPVLIQEVLWRNIWGILLFLLAFAWYGIEKKNSTITGISIGLAAALRIWPAALLLLFLIQRKKSIVLWGAVTLIVCNVLAALIFGPSVYAHYIGPIQRHEIMWVLEPENISLTGSIARWLHGHSFFPEKSVVVAEFVGALLLMGFFIFAYTISLRKRDKKIDLLLFAVLINFLVLVVPVIWYSGMIAVLCLSVPITVSAIKDTAILRNPVIVGLGGVVMIKEIISSIVFYSVFHSLNLQSSFYTLEIVIVLMLQIIILSTLLSNPIPIHEQQRSEQ